MIPNNYYINVAKKTPRYPVYGEFYCRIELGDIPLENAKGKYKEIRKLFSTDDSFVLALNHVECYGKEVRTDGLV